MFWQGHSPEYKAPTRQYQSMILYHNDNQKMLALGSKKHEEERIDSRIHTIIEPFSKFYLAEAYHQKYYLQLVMEIVKDYREVYNMEDFINSTATARVNGYIKGYGSIRSLNEIINNLGLSDKSKKRLIQIVSGYGK